MPIVGIKAIAVALAVDESTVKRYARRPRLLKGVVVRPRLRLKLDHADRVFIGATALARWREACVREHGGEEESVDVPVASEARPSLQAVQVA